MRLIFVLIISSLLTTITQTVTFSQTITAQQSLRIESFEYSGKFLDISGETEDPRASFWKPDGTLLFVVGRRSNNIAVYALEQPWQLNSASFLLQVSIPGENQHGLFFRNDGHKMWVYDRTSIWYFQLHTPWDISTLSEGERIDLSHFSQRGHDIAFKTDGTILYIDDRTTGSIFEYSLSNPWDVTSGTLTYTFDISQHQKEVRGIEFLGEGSVMMLMDTERKEVLQFNLFEPWNVSTATFSGAFDVSHQTLQGRGLSFSIDENIMYVTAQDELKIFQYETHISTLRSKDNKKKRQCKFLRRRQDRHHPASL